jgi:hypothetical protein
MSKKELVKGGCGRTAESLECDAYGFTLLIVAGIILILSMIIEKLYY